MLRLVGSLLLLLISCVATYAQDITSSPVVNTLPNDPTVGTMLNRLAKITGTGTLVLAGTGDTAIKLYVVIAGAGTTGSAVYVEAGATGCVMDNATTGKAGTVLTASTVLDGAGKSGRCHQQDAPPTNGMQIGTLLAPTTVVDGVARISGLNIAYVPGSGTGLGTVTSVGLAAPTGFTSAGGPVTASGTLTLGLATEAPNLVWAGPTSGAAAAPTFRALAAADLPAGTASGACTGDLGGTFPACTVRQAGGLWALPGDVSPTLSGPGDNYTGCDTSAVCRIDGGAADRLISGFASGTDGRVLTVCNVGTTNKLTLVDEGTASSATNRIAAGANLSLRPRACQALGYDSTTQRWRPSDTGILEPYTVRTCQIGFGSTSSGAAALPDDDDVVEACGNNTGFDWVITAVKVYANTGTPSFTPILTGGTATSILTGPCSAVAGQWAACAVNGTPTVRSFSGTGLATCTTQPCTVAGNITTAGGTVTYAWIELIGVLR
jgi:hypothetical protein